MRSDSMFRRPVAAGPAAWTVFVALLVLLVAVTGCGDGTSEAPPEASQPAGEPPAETAAEEVAADEASSPRDLSPRDLSSRDLFWNHVSELCGQAYAGSMTSQDEADADFAQQAMVMHVRRCAEDRLEIPFHVGEDRSRTWVLTRHADGLQLQHDHRHEDGTEDEVTLYGGRTAEPGTETVQFFPADDYSKELFTTHGLDVSVTNVWSFEIEPGQRFSYILRRPERHFQADFDLTAPVPAPPAPWGHEDSPSP